MDKLWLRYGDRIMDGLDAEGVELDQRLQDAFGIASPAREVTEAHILIGLYRLNTRGCDLIPPTILDVHDSDAGLAIPKGPRRPRGTILAHPSLYKILDQAISYDPERRTLGATNFLRAVLEDASKRGESYADRSFAADLLVACYGADYQEPLSNVKPAQALLRLLQNTLDGSDDYQYNYFSC